MNEHKNNFKLPVRPGHYTGRIVRWWESEESWHFVVSVNGKEMLYTELAFYGEPRKFNKGDEVEVVVESSGGYSSYIASMVR